jgi:hypothetical protein
MALRPGRLDAADLAELLPPTVKNPSSAFRVQAAVILGVLYVTFILLLRIPKTTTFEAWIIALALVLLVLKLNSTRLSWLISEVVGAHRYTKSLMTYNPDSEAQPTQASRIEPGDAICLKLEREETSDLSLPYLVMALQMRSSGRLDLGLMQCHHLESVDPDARYLRYQSSPTPDRQNDRRSAESTGKTLIELISIVPYGKSIKENLLVKQLRAAGRTSDIEIRQAMRISLFVGFIARHPSRSYILEFFKVFSKARTGGHPSCNIELTELGLLWINSATLDVSDGTPSSTTIYQGGVHQLGNNYTSHGPVGAMGENNVVQESHITQNNEGISSAQTETLARELAELTATLRTLATDPTHYHALGDLASAQLAAGKGDIPTAVTYLSKLGKAGKWVLDVAASLGIPVAVSAIKEALHLPTL